MTAKQVTGSDSPFSYNTLFHQKYFAASCPNFEGSLLSRSSSRTLSSFQSNGYTLFCGKDKSNRK
jgi:hypothetical protein